MAAGKNEVQYRVVKQVWLRNILRYPGYILSIEDIGSKGDKGIKHLLNLKVLEKI